MTTNRRDLAEIISNATGLSKTDSLSLVNLALAAITAKLTNGETIRLNGFGTFSVTDSPAAMRRNPLTNERFEVPAHKRIKFKPSQTLKEAVNETRD